MFLSCTGQASGCVAQGGLSPRLHRYWEISGRRNRASLLLPANSRESHRLSCWGLARLATGDRAVCQVVEWVLLFLSFDFPGRCERKREGRSQYVFKLREAIWLLTWRTHPKTGTSEKRGRQFDKREALKIMALLRSEQWGQGYEEVRSGSELLISN